MSKRILFVDDDPFASKALCAPLRDHGFLVDDVSNVPAALSCVQVTLYDLAIVDVMMPTGGLDFMETKGGFETGIALARRLKQESETLKILGITQREAPEVVEWFNTQGNGLCSKRDALLNPRNFIRQVDDLLQNGDVEFASARSEADTDHLT
jgi:CheY-like chemotaxis protein